MYVDLDFILALIKDDDWLSDKAEEIYKEYKDELWTSDFTLLELMLVAYRDNKNINKVLANAEALIEIKGHPDHILAAGNYVQNHGLTPFDAVHLVKSNDDIIISSDKSYDEFSKRIKLEDGLK